MFVTLALSSLLLAQAPGSGWAMVDAPPGEVRRLHWELHETTEVWVRLTPGDPGGERPLVNVVFQAFFPGRARRDRTPACRNGLQRLPRG